ncbi:MAG TPA: hypothetical protein VFF60_08300 [Candidatus Binatus sp.]|nr:hypothetical protein [Candidatus Binatus sp.]
MPYATFGIIDAPIIALIVLPFLIICGFLLWRYASKAGFPGWLGLLFLIPYVNIALFIVGAFVEWPAERALKELGRESSSRTPPSV